MLHAGVLKKFGLYGLLRIALPLLPQGANVPWVQNALLLMLLGNILVMGLVTIRASRLDDTLANSSVMHMGYIFLALAAGSEIALKGAVPGQIAFLCESAGLPVLALKRLRIGRVSLARMPEGEWRYLPAGERF